jgi:hypothetical protein
MKRLIKFGSIGLVIAGAIALGGEASAQFVVPDLYLQTRISAQSGTTFQLGVKGTPNTIKKIGFSGISSSRTRTIRVNSCGFGTISNVQSITSGVVNTPSGQFTASTLAASAPIIQPTCTNGVLSSPLPTTGNFFNVGGGTVLVKGLTANTVQDLSYTDTAPQTRNVTINACGFGVVTIPFSATSVIPEGGINSTLSTLQRGSLTCTAGELYVSELPSLVANQFAIPAIADLTRSFNNVFIKTTPLNVVPVIVNGAVSTRSVTSDRCSGLLIGSAVSPITGTVTINGVSINTATLPIGTVKACGQYSEGGTTGYAYATGNINSPWDANLTSFRTTGGAVFIRSYPGLPIGSRSILALSTTADRTVNLTANACGISTLRSTTSFPLTPATEFTYNSATQLISSLTNGVAPRCTPTGLTYKAN